MNITEELSKIQKALKAPKNQRNDFGKYNYRSCEDILEAVKPLLPNGSVVTISDEIVECGGRVYVKATACFILAGEAKEEMLVMSCTAYAREPESRKGMDASQITGAASSYARKYALNGLLLIDDTKDADATHKGDDNNANVTVQKQRYATKEQTTTILALGKENDLSEKETKQLVEWYRRGSKLTHEEADEMVDKFKEILDKYIDERIDNGVPA